MEIRQISNENVTVARQQVGKPEIETLGTGKKERK